jgi:transcriptional regulator with XRE-family HTH domain
MNKSTLHNYCNGVIPRNLMKLQELADLLGVTLSELASGKAQASALPSFPEDLEERFEVTIKRLGKNIP